MCVSVCVCSVCVCVCGVCGGVCGVWCVWCVRCVWCVCVCGVCVSISIYLSKYVYTRNTKRRSITVPLTSCLTGLD